jgi:hypothetical protein
MTKIKLNNTQDFKNLLTELKEDEGSQLSFQAEETPISFPCMAIHHYSNDTDIGSSYMIEFIYPTDFNVMTKEEQIEKERELLETLREQSLIMLERLKNNGNHPHIDFQRAKEVIGRIFFNELDYINRETDDYYELYMDYYFKDQEL